MTDPGRSAKPARRRQDNDALSARPTETADRLGPNGRGPAPDVQQTATVGEGEHEQYHGEKPVAEARPAGETSGVDASRSKSELYDEARDAGIEGRSAMNKEQLVEALREHRAARPPRQAPGGRPGTRRRPRSEGRRAVGEADSARAVGPAGEARRPERCAIVYEGSGRRGEFQVVVTERGGSRRSLACSPSFRAPGFGPVRRRGPARVAHELLVSRLEACGWWPVDSGGSWHELGFVRLGDAGLRSNRSLVTVVRERGRARFVAEELDSYGNPTPVMVSAPFRAARLLRVRPTRQARAALKQLVELMEAEGWNVAAAVGKHWYSISLWRPADRHWEPLAPKSGAGRHSADPA